jgi:hypothetical protein
MSKEKELLENILIKMNRIFDDYIALDDKYRRLLEQKSQSDRELVLKKEELQQAEERIKSLKMSQGLPLSSQEQQEMRDRIDEYIKEIDKCIGLLSE